MSLAERPAIVGIAPGLLPSVPWQAAQLSASANGLSCAVAVPAAPADTANAVAASSKRLVMVIVLPSLMSAGLGRRHPTAILCCFGPIIQRDRMLCFGEEQPALDQDSDQRANRRGQRH